MRLNQFDEGVLISAIAQADYLMDYVSSEVDREHRMAFEDHHYFNPHEVSHMKLKFEQLSTTSK